MENIFLQQLFTINHEPDTDIKAEDTAGKKSNSLLSWSPFSKAEERDDNYATYVYCQVRINDINNHKAKYKKGRERQIMP